MASVSPMASVGAFVATVVLIFVSSDQYFRAPPRSRSLRSQADALPGKVVTLGDSYASGTGIHRYGGDYDEEFGGRATLDGESYVFTKSEKFDCWREDDTTPGARYGNLSSVNKASRMYACKGAEIPYVRRQFEYANAMDPEYASQQWPQSVIVLSVGGNDLMNDDGEPWPRILRRCITELHPFRGCHQNPKNQLTNWGNISDSLFELYKLVGTGAAAAKIRVLGYPLLFQPSPGCRTVGGITVAEARWADEETLRLNAMISSSVDRAVNYFRDVVNSSVDISFVDVTSYFTFGACDETDERQINDLQLSWSPLISESSFHPTQKGYDGYYRALVASL